MRLIDADALENEGWSLCRTYQKDKDTMVYEVKKPSDFSIIEERKTGTWEKQRGSDSAWNCSVCKEIVIAMPEQMGYPLYDYCPHCSSYNGGKT